jgi:hypothetical protein
MMTAGTTTRQREGDPMARPAGSDEPTVLVRRSEFQELVRASHRNVTFAYTGGAVGVAAAVLLAISEGGVVLWVAIFAIVGVALIAWGVRESRSLARRYGPVGRSRQASPFEAFDGMEANREHLAAHPFVDPGDRNRR